MGLHRASRSLVTAGRSLVTVALLVTVVASASTPASAEFDTADRLVDPRPANSWGVDGLDPGSGNFQYYSPVFALEEVGNSMIVGGKFLEVTNGAETHAQPYLAAFDVDTGDWLPAFDPSVTWSVFDLASDPANNRLVVGGEFDSVEGDSAASGFATINPTTGNLDPAFDVTVAAFGGAQPRVHALDIAGGYLYLGGYFSSITGSDGVTVQVNRLARVSLATGIVDASWTPWVSGGSVWEIAVDQTNGRVLFGGTFTVVDAISTAAFAMVEVSDGSLSSYDTGFGLYYYGQGNYSFASAIEVTPTRYLIGGQRHRLLVTDPDLNVVSVHVTNQYNAANNGRGGDIQAIEVSGDVAFIACHCWGQVNREEADKTPTDEYTDVRSAYAVDITTGELLDWFQPDFSGTAGPWALAVDKNDCLWLGTDAVQSGQKAARGVVTLCEADNLADRPGVTAMLSSTSGAAFDAAANAIDNDYRTNDSIATGFAITLPEDTPYLEIDLGAVRSVDDVMLWARTDAERLDLANVHIWASATSLDTDDWTELRNNPAVTEYVRLGSHGGKRTLTIGVNRDVRYLRIEADFTGAPDALQLAEVGVTGSDLALGDPITLTSTFKTKERVVLHWDPSGPVTVFRDDVEIGTDSDGWFVDLDVEPGTTYDYRVDSQAGQTASVAVTTDGGGVSAPTLNSTLQTRERIVLHWSPDEQVDIFRDGVLIANDDDGWHADIGLAAGTSYTYRIETPDGRTAEFIVATLS
ncbi:MAG: hypothetical protein ACI8TP_002101 [Acidimicrobiales bacterium]|jgi:hypothetical protein